MAKYSKFIGAIVGGFVGWGFLALGIGEDVIPSISGPVTDVIMVHITAALGSLLAPKNAE